MSVPYLIITFADVLTSKRDTSHGQKQTRKKDMKIELLTEAEVASLNTLIESSENIVVCCHKSPDGDALGSSLAWNAYLTSRGKQTNVIVPDAFPDFLKWIPGADRIIRFDKNADKAGEMLEKADLIFCLDFNGADRVDEMREPLEQAKAKKVMIDHHLDPSMDTVLTISHPNMSSTSELVFRIVWQLGAFEEMTKEWATCVYCGMMTDTGGFTYNSTQPEIFFIISQLLTKNINRKAQIVYERKDGTIDERPEELPFDINQDVIELTDADYAIWYMDAMENYKKYDRKKVKFLALVYNPDKLKKGVFVPGRFAMTCCIEDVTFIGFKCKYDREEELPHKSWITITAEIRVEFAREYKGKGPVLYPVSIEKAQKPEDELVYFS